MTKVARFRAHIMADLLEEPDIDSKPAANSSRMSTTEIIMDSDDLNDIDDACDGINRCRNGHVNNDYSDNNDNKDDDDNTEEDEEGGEEELRGLVGLQNLGNTCYMNGALQALSNCQQLTRFVLDCPGFIKSTGLSRCYTDLIREIWAHKNPIKDSHSQYAVPTSIIRNIKCIYPAFRGCTQQDAQEFLRCFLEQLHDELKQPVINSNKAKRKNGETIPDLYSPSPTLSSNSSQNSSLHDFHVANCDNDNQCQQQQQQHQDSTKLNHFDNNCDEDDSMCKNGTRSAIEQSQTSAADDNAERSIISDMFEFKISSSVVCSSCNYISTTKETFKDLSIPIPARDHPYYQQTAKDDLQQQQQPQLHRQHQSKSRSKLDDCQDGSEEGDKSSDDSDNLHGNNDSDDNVSLDGSADDVTQSRSYYLGALALERWISSLLSHLGSWFWGPQVTLQDCLSIFFGTDPLEGDNEYSCDVCTKKNKGVKYLQILELPEVLCIHFKRYASIGSAKITTHVSFPLTGLDLAPFMSDNSQPQCTTYNLIACICHHGSALLNGHYTTYALNCYDDQWYEFDDQYVSNVSSYQVENSEAYILFYQKTTLDDSRDRQRLEASKLLRKSSCETKKYFISRQWINRFNTFVEPGPITNHDFLCAHGRVSRSKQAHVSDLCHPISHRVWLYLHGLHGGGPECCELVTCDDCN